MKEIKAIPNRKWVIKAGIAFLVVMALLTFFSNTIMNYSLPQVTVVYSTSGSMTTAIKGTGTIEAINQAKVVATGARKIDQVFLGVFEDVVEGTVIATYAPVTEEEKEELIAAQKELKALLDQKIADDLQKPVYDYSMQERSISDAKAALDEANATLAAAQGKSAAITAAQIEANAAQNNIDSLTAELEALNNTRISKAQAVSDAQTVQDTANANLLTAQTTYSKAQTELVTAQNALTAGTGTQKEVDDAQKAVDNAAAVVSSAQTAVNQAPTALEQAKNELAAVDQQINEKNAALKSANTALTAANDKLAAAQALPEIKDATDSLTMAQRSYDDSVKALADQKKADGISQQIAAMAEEDKKKALEAAQKKVDDLTALSEQTEIVAAKSGRIAVVNIASGAETVKGDVLVIIDVVEDGFKVPMTFTADQTAQMQLGMGARLDYYGSSEQDATIVAIKPDSTDPRNKKTVTFLLNDPDNNYWFSSGASVTLSLNNRSRDYQCIVPLSAVHEESGETFVYSIKTKSSPLGERYIAVKVPVTILAKDDTNAAIDPAALGEYGSSVITETNDKSFASGDQVRLAEGL